MNQDHASAPQAAKTMLDMQATPAFNVCDRFGNGQALKQSCSLRRFTQALRAWPKLATKIGFWQNEPNLRDPTAELGRLSLANKLGE